MKPIYLHIISHIGDLIPGLFSSEDFSGRVRWCEGSSEGNDSISVMNSESEAELQSKNGDSAVHEVEMADFRMKPCLFAVIRCILYVRLIACLSYRAVCRIPAARGSIDFFEKKKKSDG